MLLGRDTGNWWHVITPSDKVEGAAYSACKNRIDIYRTTQEIGQPITSGQVCRKCMAELGRALYSLGTRLPAAK